MIKKKPLSALIICCLFSIFLFLGCGENASDPPSGGGAGPAPGPAPITGTIIAGSVVDGFVAGATVTAYQISANGTRGAQIGSATTTGASGNYSINLGSYTGPVLVEAAGGSYRDWATGAIVNLGAADKMAAVIANVTGSVTTHITPLTNMAALRALQDISVNNTPIATAIDTANANVGKYFGNFDIIKDVPIDPTIAGSATGIAQTSIDYGLVLAGISQNAFTNVPQLQPFSLAAAMGNDARDGFFDGLQGAATIPVATTAGGTTNLTATAAKGALSTGITAFQNNPAKNLSGGTVTPKILTDLSSPTNTGTVSSKPDVPSQFTAVPISSSQISLTWTAPNGAVSYKIYRGGTLIKSVTATSTEDTGLSANTQYCYAVSASDAGGNESIKTSALCATTSLAPPPVPTGLAVNATSHSQINVAWSASAGATGYRIYRDGVKVADVTTTSLSDTGLTPSNQYCYTVSAYDAGGNESAQCDQLCATTMPQPPPVPPAIPTGLTATAASQSQIDLTWAAVTGASSYAINRDGAYWTTTAGTTISNTGLTANTSYCYTVAALDASGGSSLPSSAVCVTTPTPPPPVPTGLTVTPASSSVLNLSWTASAGATGYRVYRGGVFLSAVTATTHTDAGLSSGTSYCYTISSHDATGSESAKSTSVCANTQSIPAPTNLTVTAVSQSRIDLTWTAVAGVSGYRIYRDSALLRSSTLTALSDEGLTAGTTYCYGVSAFDVANNESPRSSQLCATTYSPPPPVPADLSVRATSPTQVDLSWSASTGASQYKIYRNGVLLTAVAAPATTYSDTTVVANTQYSYTISAIDATGSESSQTAASTPHTGLTVPANVTATVNSSTQITVSWTNSGGVLVTGYKVYKAGALLGAVTATSFLDGGLTPNTQYCYNVSSTSTAGGESALSSSVCGTTPPLPEPASIELLASNTQLNSDGATTVTMTANVKDGDNRAIKDQDVTFSADSGVLVVTNAKTDANGNATATLGPGGDPTNRAITVTAAAGSITATNTVNVTGTTISISGPQSMSFGDSRDLTIFLKNSAGTGIAGKTITVTSANGNTLAPQPTYVTNASGQITVRVTATSVLPVDTITATAIGTTKTFDLNVSAAILNINPPTPGQKININTWQAVTATYTNGGVAVVGATVQFTTTRGTLDAASDVTDGAGVATVNVRSTNSGPAEIAASVTPGPSTQVAVEFVATTPASIIAQASPALIGTNAAGLDSEKSLITAVVRDTNNNLVAGQTVNFTIVSDVSGGNLSPASAITDSYGTANTYFIAGGATTPLDGVEIRATVGALSTTTTLTVGGKALFITLATGNEVIKIDPNTYQKDFVALVTDAAGHPVQNAVVVPTVTPMHYKKGYYRWLDPVWVPVETLATASSTLPAVPACKNEDMMLNDPRYDLNGVLDVDPVSGAKEDQNGNDRLDPGGVASVTATLTDSTGRSTVSVVYARDYANWLNVKLEAWTGNTGSTASAVAIFNLPGAGPDYSDETSSPPGNPSPFGISTTCFVDLTVTPVSSSQISLAWQKTVTAASYNIYRDGALVKNVIVNTTEDTGLAGGTQYCYEVRTVSAAGVVTPFTGTVCGTTSASAAVPPATPTGLAATPGVTGLGDPIVTLNWNPVVGVALYNIYRGDSVGGPLTLQLSATASGVIDAGVVAQTGYCYAITSVSVSGNESAKSAPDCTATF